MTEKLPVNGTWLQNNRTDVLGTLWSSFNLNLTEKLGSTMVSPRTLITTDNTAGLGATCAFQTFTTVESGLPVKRYWGASGKFIWRAESTNGYIDPFIQDTTTGTPDGSDISHSCQDDLSDLIVFGPTYLIATTQADIYYISNTNNSTWTNIGPSTLAASSAHMMGIAGGRVYITDALTKVRSLVPGTWGAPTTSGSYFLDLSMAGYPVTAITTIRTVSDGEIWVFTINSNENACYGFKWDGITTNVVSPYEIKDAGGVLAAIIKDNEPWVIDTNGRLLAFNGGAFIEVPNGRLPIRPKKLLANSLNSRNSRWIHPNGISLVDGRINILINNQYNDAAGSIEENLPSGVWEYDESVGWYHKSSLSLYTSGISDFGQNRIANVGALYVPKTTAATVSTDGAMLLGAQYFSDATTTKFGIWTDNVDDTIQKGGYLVTDKIFGASIEDIWQKAYIQFKPFLDAGDVIRVKYTTSDIEPSEITITWTSTTTFTTTADLTLLGFGIGDEVEGIQGKGSGQTAHILAAVAAAGLTTVTLDSAFTGVGTSGTAKVRLQKWVSCDIPVTHGLQYKEWSIGINASWIKLKVYMTYTGRDLINNIYVVNSGSKNIT